MAWTAPMTAVTGNILTAANWNTHVRDNLLQTSPAKATTAGRFMATSGLNSIVERVPSTSEVPTFNTTNSSAYVDLAVTGPSVTVTTGTRAMVWWGCSMSNDTFNGHSVMAIRVSGATPITENDDDSVNFRQTPFESGQISQMMFGKFYTGLTAGSNTFTAKYKSVGGTGTSNFGRRRIIVLPF